MIDLSTSDMILLHNLLMGDAHDHEENFPAIAEDRRNLAAKFKEEVERRDVETLAKFNRESA